MNKEALRKELEDAIVFGHTYPKRSERDTYITTRLAAIDGNSKVVMAKCDECGRDIYDNEVALNRGGIYCWECCKKMWGIDETKKSKPLDDGQEGKGLPKFLVIDDHENNYAIWTRGQYESYVSGALEVGGCPAVRIVVGFNGNEDFLFPALPVADGEGEKVGVMIEYLDSLPVSSGEGFNMLKAIKQKLHETTLPSAVTGGVKDEAIGFSMWLQSLNKSGYPKNENGTMVDIWQLYNYWNSKVDKKPYYLHSRFDDANPLQPNHPSEGQPAQGNLLSAAKHKRDLLFDVLNSYERRIALRAAAEGFLKSFDELLEVAP